MLAESPGLKIGFLWFQCLKGYGCDLQKSNETLRERQFEKLKAQRRFAGYGSKLETLNAVHVDSRECADTKGAVGQVQTLMATAASGRSLLQ